MPSVKTTDASWPSKFAKSRVKLLPKSSVQQKEWPQILNSGCFMLDFQARVKRQIVYIIYSDTSKQNNFRCLHKTRADTRDEPVDLLFVNCLCTCKMWKCTLLSVIMCILFGPRYKVFIFSCLTSLFLNDSNQNISFTHNSLVANMRLNMMRSDIMLQDHLGHINMSLIIFNNQTEASHVLFSALLSKASLVHTKVIQEEHQRVPLNFSESQFRKARRSIQQRSLAWPLSQLYLNGFRFIRVTCLHFFQSQNYVLFAQSNCTPQVSSITFPHYLPPLMYNRSPMKHPLLPPPVPPSIHEPPPPPQSSACPTARQLPRQRMGQSAACRGVTQDCWRW